MTKRAWMNLSVVAVLVVGCGSKQSSPSKPPAETAQQPSMCSMMKDAELAATDGEHDVTITFTTAGDPTELRAHIHEMGARHDRMAHGGGMGSGDMGGGGMGSGGTKEGMHGHMAMVPSHATVDDVDHGARVVLTPDDPAQLAALRDQVHAHVDMMKSGKCPMMEEHDAHHDM